MHSLVSNDQLSSSEFTELPSQLASPTVKKHSILISDHHQQMLNELQQTRREPQFCDHALIFLSYVLFVIGMPFSLCLSIRIVPEYQRAVIFRLGRILQGGAKGPGLIFVLPCLDNLVIVDLRTITFNVPPQEILTKDSVTVNVDAVVYFRIFDPVASVINVENAQYSTRLLAATSLRNILGTKTLQEVLQDRESLAHHMQEILDETTGKFMLSGTFRTLTVLLFLRFMVILISECVKTSLLSFFVIVGICDNRGVMVERVEVKDVRLPVQLQRAMATEAEATREARAKVVAAQGEQNASVALKEAADTINKCPIALQLRYLQTLTHIAAEKNSTIVFPIPVEFIQLMASNVKSSTRGNESDESCKPKVSVSKRSAKKEATSEESRQRSVSPTTSLKYTIPKIIYTSTN